MAVEKAQEVMQMRRAGWRSFLEQIKNYAFLFYCFTLSASLIVITWCAFTIQTQNRFLDRIERKLETQTVYMGVMENNYKNMTKEFNKLQEKL